MMSRKILESYVRSMLDWQEHNKKLQWNKIIMAIHGTTTRYGTMEETYLDLFGNTMDIKTNDQCVSVV